MSHTAIKALQVIKFLLIFVIRVIGMMSLRLCANPRAISIDQAFWQICNHLDGTNQDTSRLGWKLLRKKKCIDRFPGVSLNGYWSQRATITQSARTPRQVVATLVAEENRVTAVPVENPTIKSWSNPRQIFEQVPGANEVLGADLAVGISDSVSEKSNHVPYEERQVAIIGASVAVETNNFLILQNVVVDGGILIVRIFGFVGPLLIIRVQFDGMRHDAVHRFLRELVRDETHETAFHFQDM